MIRIISDLEQLWMESFKDKMIQMEILMMAMQVLTLIKFQGLTRFIYKIIIVLEILLETKNYLKNNFKLTQSEILQLETLKNNNK